MYDEEEEEEEGEDQQDFLFNLIWHHMLINISDGGKLMEMESNVLILFSDTSEVTTPVNSQWPDIEEIRKLPFDPYPRDPKFNKASPVFSDKSLKGQQKYANIKQQHSHS